jgi:acetoin utilization deacetylase AcuC-like enzyme
MQVIVSPYFEAIGPGKLLYRGNFVAHHDVSQRGREILLGLVDAGCEIDFALLPELNLLDLHEAILSVHDAQYVDYLKDAWFNWSQMENASMEIYPNISPNRHSIEFCEHPVALAGWYIADCAAPIGEHTWQNALGSVSAVLQAVSLLKKGENIYSLCRPSGHHACRDMAMGMCFLNNAAIAAQALCQQFQRVAILDIDLHHGNGAQQIFDDRADVLTLSIHANPANFYPFYTGFEAEIGSGAGTGMNGNFPLPAGTDEITYLEVLELAKNKVLEFGTEALVVAAGFDTFKSDPLGCFALESRSYYKIGQAIRSFDLPTLFVQEGGYFVPALRENVRQLVSGFES